MPTQSVQLKRGIAAAMAQTLQIRSHTLTADVNAEEGGEDAGPSPHDLYDAALGACKALTVMWYARKKGIPVDDVQTAIERDDSGERSGVYKLTARLKIAGPVTDAQLKELTAVAAKCPVHKLMTSVTTDIATEVERLS